MVVGENPHQVSAVSFLAVKGWEIGNHIPSLQTKTSIKHAQEGLRDG